MKSVTGCVLFFLGLSLLLLLGGWQWRRGIEKAAIEAALETPQGQPPHYTSLDRAPQKWLDLAYQPVRLEGGWLADQVFLLANRTHRGRLGFEVFSPFQLAGDQSTLLVNRGWIAVAEESATLATLNAALKTSLPGHAEASGRLYLPQKGFTLGPAHHHQAGWPKTIQYIDPAGLSATLGVALQPAALALAPSHPAAFAPLWHNGWQAAAFNSSRHFGYAAQWWGLALTLLIFGVIWQRQAAARASSWSSSRGRRR